MWCGEALSPGPWVTLFAGARAGELTGSYRPQLPSLQRGWARSLRFSPVLESHPFCSFCLWIVHLSLKFSNKQEFLPLGSREWVELSVALGMFCLTASPSDLHSLLTLRASTTSQACVLLLPSWLRTTECWERAVSPVVVCECCSFIFGLGKF